MFANFSKANVWVSTLKKNTVMRKQATNDFEKNFYMLMSKACFGKTMKFHYDEMLPRYSCSQLKVAYKDTDSLLYLIETPDLDNNMASSKHLLDFSDYHLKHLLHDQTNENTINDARRVAR